MTKRELEIALMRAHEERMSRTPKELFPRPPGPPGKRILCRGCGKEFEQPTHNNRPRVWCSNECKDRIWRHVRKPPRLPVG